MALSGSFSGSIVDGKYALRVDWSATQNVSGNTSKITCVMYLVQASSWSLNIASRSDNETTINGTDYTWASPAINNGGGRTTKLATVTSGNIAHDATGAKSVTLSAVFNIRATISGSYRASISASQTVTLNTIPRATQPTVSSSSVDMGTSVTISTPRASGSFTHDLAYSFEGGSYVSIATGVGTSRAWTVPDVASAIPNATSGRMTIRCITKNASATIGTKYAYLTAKVPADIIPTVGTVTTTEATTGLAARFGAYIQGKSTIRASIAASGRGGSTIKAYSTTFAGKTYTGASWTSSVVASSGTLALVTRVQDSRGRWSASKTTNISVLAYTAPQVQTLTARRVTSTGTADEQGTYIAVRYKYSLPSLNGGNTAAMTIQHKRSTVTTWSNMMTGSALTADTTARPTTVTFSTDYQYDIRLTVTDWFGASRSYTTTLPSGAVIIDLRAAGDGVAIGKTAEQAGIDLGWAVVGEALSTSASTGVWQPRGGPLIQWGSVNITPTAVNTATEATVTFTRAYASLPVVLITHVTGLPNNVRSSITSRANNRITIELYRTDNTTTTSVHWFAIGAPA